KEGEEEGEEREGGRWWECLFIDCSCINCLFHLLIRPSTLRPFLPLSLPNVLLLVSPSLTHCSSRELKPDAVPSQASSILSSLLASLLRSSRSSSQPASINLLPVYIEWQSINELSPILILEDGKGREGIERSYAEDPEGVGYYGAADKKRRREDEE
ncbi:hypothetical protein PMAYCL1PPCAC_29785, partial [Pristionchus mayeri]